jgi:hypothetical protein
MEAGSSYRAPTQSSEFKPQYLQKTKRKLCPQHINSKIHYMQRLKEVAFCTRVPFLAYSGIMAKARNRG